MQRQCRLFPVHDDVRTHQFDHFAFFVCSSRFVAKVGGQTPFELFRHILPECRDGARLEGVAELAAPPKEVGFALTIGGLVDAPVDERISQAGESLVYQSKVTLDIENAIGAIGILKRDLLLEDANRAGDLSLSRNPNFE